ncbi:hypothetical protein AHAS_Ahas19G0309000 [Arachis hypogaea]
MDVSLPWMIHSPQQGHHDRDSHGEKDSADDDHHGRDPRNASPAFTVLHLDEEIVENVSDKDVNGDGQLKLLCISKEQPLTQKLE